MNDGVQKDHPSISFKRWRHLVMYAYEYANTVHAFNSITNYSSHNHKHNQLWNAWCCNSIIFSWLRCLLTQNVCDTFVYVSMWILLFVCMHCVKKIIINLNNHQRGCICTDKFVIGFVAFCRLLNNPGCPFVSSFCFGTFVCKVCVWWFDKRLRIS